ncbi:P-loop containing nucleoside triphosphate hydrolase protein [Lineolata rhizophorae]|uniref:P-loop containing nucleoside triphosphate hydrolase protein n=1 Tax=Lineolata rhizophorae TaxID=578093 RepID=A0A6A6P2D2_9PEZI|nr:P-loop containing nucleoside triphosphate hydrolase protein [Lineolata rhizophorae]
MSNSLEAKIVVLGSQGVGKTSLVHRYVKNAFTPPTTTSTIGASFLTKRVVDIDTSTVVRLQIWDTAGQERFRSISKLYYRGANAAVLCYDITSAASFEEMGRWFLELKQNLGEDVILHVVGTKSDVVAEDPSRRKVPFDRCIAYVAENLYPSSTQALLPGASASAPITPGVGGGGSTAAGGPGTGSGALASPASNRSSGFWGQDAGWDCCHEISAKDGEGVEEVFRVITRKLVEQRHKRIEAELALTRGFVGGHAGSAAAAAAAGVVNGYLPNGAPAGYFDHYPYGYGAQDGNGSFRVGAGDKRRSWLGLPMTPGALAGQGMDEWEQDMDRVRQKRGGRCC